uniref:NADH dehydrogenase subunit 4L n=1 Tax=Lasmigona complanata TaxID=85050 RepID=UPI00226CE7B9|nr:NADH dehydrogenase subunit 4L [Lasmigona complanata]UZC55589.1 NADH dehydrogenase subunit 4L [Lasmigona complanata]
MWFIPLKGVGVIGILLGMVCLVTQRKSFFGVLLSLEIFTLGCYILIFSLVYFQGSFSYVCLVFLAISVCEAALGLSLLVSLVRSAGSDYVASMVLSHF